ncbi:hypothetical protein WA026_001304 [Henosepilachna vigintioctopunctata]|uniref:Enoyl-[acyl-carrier-protein] reductase, mitochondrial n=1 Tax=Henosepilachna vigintioctopunctata TaxID=420089 RepID=A0AAW1UKS0_9CUCU
MSNSFTKVVFSTKFSQNLRFMSSVFRGHQLVYSEFGEPARVVQKQECTTGAPGNNDVVIKMIAAPINPADINTIQGKYPVKPTFPAVAGNEGVGEIVSVGPDISDIKVGDRVITLKNGLGTWRTHLTINRDNVLKVPKKLGLVEAATLSVNPCTAFRMLKDFEKLKPGDTVIQNGANSACGQSIIQICRAWGLRTVNVVRNRDNLDELVAFLKGLGATHILTEDSLRTTKVFLNGDLSKPKLALNCVGGQSALEILRHLDNNGTMVTYGGMSREPVTVPTSALIFKDVKIRGFWLTRWSKENADSIDRYEMFEELISMMTNNELQGPAYQMVDFVNFKEALLNTMTIKGMAGKKYILNFEKA